LLNLLARLLTHRKAKKKYAEVDEQPVDVSGEDDEQQDGDEEEEGQEDVTEKKQMVEDDDAAIIELLRSRKEAIESRKKSARSLPEYNSITKREEYDKTEANR